MSVTHEEKHMLLAPRSGCYVYDYKIGPNCTIPVEYEVIGGEPAGEDGPGYPDGVVALNAFVNGYWVNAEDLFGDMLEVVESRIAEARQ